MGQIKSCMARTHLYNINLYKLMRYSIPIYLPKSAQDPPPWSSGPPRFNLNRVTIPSGACGSIYNSWCTAHNSQSRAHNSQSRAHNSQSRAHNSQSRAHNSQSRVHNSQSRAHNSQSRAHNSQRTQTDDTTALKSACGTRRPRPRAHFTNTNGSSLHVVSK